MSILKLENVTKIYDKRSIFGVKNLSFEVSAGEVVCLTGPSGSGKTTTLNMICKTLNPESGTIHSPTRLSYIPQLAALNEEQTVFTNILMGITENMEEEQKLNLARLAAASLELTNEIEKLPSQISGGQRQRVIMARALVSEPELIIMDEPFAHLDNVLRCELIENLWEVFRDKGIAILWVTHETADALAHSDRILILNYGSLQQDAKPIDIYTSPANMFVAQFFGNANCIAGKVLDYSTRTYKILGKELQYHTSLPENPNNEVLVILRPEIFIIDDNGKFKGILQRSLYFGDHLLYEIKSAEFLIQIKASSKQNYQVGSKINFNIDESEVYCLKEI